MINLPDPGILIIVRKILLPFPSIFVDVISVLCVFNHNVFE